MTWWQAYLPLPAKWWSVNGRDVVKGKKLFELTFLFTLYFKAKQRKLIILEYNHLRWKQAAIPLAFLIPNSSGQQASKQVRKTGPWQSDQIHSDSIPQAALGHSKLFFLFFFFFGFYHCIVLEYLVLRYLWILGPVKHPIRYWFWCQNHVWGKWKGIWNKHPKISYENFGAPWCGPCWW